MNKNLSYRSLLILVSLSMVFGFFPAQSVAAHVPGVPSLQSTPPPDAPNAPDPLPPMDTSTPAVGELFDPEEVLAILDPGWTAPYTTDLTTSLAWGDFNIDGDLDLFIGNDGLNRLYENVGGDLTEILTLVCETAQQDHTSSVAWADYDIDGDLDIAIGNDGGKNCVYRYDQGTGTFIQAWLASESQNTKSVAWTGWSLAGEYSSYLAVGNSGESYIYRYDGVNFSPWQNLGSSLTSSLAWGDYDNDGDPDLAVGNFGAANLIYRNDLDPSGLILADTLSGAMNTRSVAWGDMDNDGDLDLAVGNGKSGAITHADQVYCNSGSPGYTFSVCWTSNDTSPTQSVAWGDYEGDGDLDLAASSAVNGLTRIYINNGGLLATSPNWDANDFSATSTSVAWADVDGDGDLEFTIGYQGLSSLFYENTAGNISPADVGAANFDTRSVAWGDMDDDGDLDLAVANSSNQTNNVYCNGGFPDYTLTLCWTSNSANNSRSVAWGDFDGDLDLDLVVGNGQNLSGRPNIVYENIEGMLDPNPYPLFIDSTVANTYAVAWGDYDGDQDLDLASGNYGSAQPNYIHINRGGVFTETIAVGPASDRTLSLAWGDFDQDFDLDLVVGNQAGSNKVYVNEGDGNFTSQTLPDACSNDTRSVAWSDWDGDGDLDIAVGNAGTAGCLQVITTSGSPGNWTFTTAWQSTALNVISLAWGNYDGDSRPDLAVGVSGDFGGRNAIFRTTGSEMVQTWLASADDPTNSIAWGDYDNDGDLDVAVGNVSSPVTPNRLYTNNWNDATRFANNQAYAKIHKPGETDETWFFSMHEIIGSPTIDISYTLYDREYDQAFKIEPQVSWDGGGNWEPAWPAVGGDGTTMISASPSGDDHIFTWDVLNQLLDHQGIPFDPESGVYVPFDQSDEEVDVAFRILVWSNPEHGGLIQRPAFGSDTTLFRVDMRPDWFDSVKLADLEVVHPGEIIDYSIAITQADHGMPPEAYLADEIPWPHLELVGPPTANTGVIDWAADAITWTQGVLPFESQLLIDYSLEATIPLTNGLEIPNCAEIYDGQHEPFDRCTTVVISSTPIITESYKLVNSVESNTAFPGDVLTYTILLTNTGTDNARDAWLVDEIPDHVVWANNLSATCGGEPCGEANYSNGVVTWTGDIEVYNPVLILYNVLVEKPLYGNTIITNTFEVNDGVNPSFVSQPVTTTVLSPDLRPSVKVGSAPVVGLGDVLTYTIVISNVGEIDAYTTTLTDPLPGTSLYVPGSFWSSSGMGGFDPSGVITWTGDVLIESPVEVSFAITVGLPSLPEPFLVNIAWVEDPVGGLITLTETTDVILADLASSYKTATPSLVELEHPLTYTLMLNNTGGFGPDVLLTDPISSVGEYIADSFWASSGVGMYDPYDEVITWQGDIDTSETVSMTFAVAAMCPVETGGSMLVNQAYLAGPIPEVITMTASSMVDLPDLSSSTLEADLDQVEVGDHLSYMVVIRNVGGNAPHITMSDILPSSVTWTGNYTISSGFLEYRPAFHEVYWEGALARYEIATITFEVVVNPTLERQITNTIELWDSCSPQSVDSVITQVSGWIFLPVVFR